MEKNGVVLDQAAKEGHAVSYILEIYRMYEKNFCQLFKFPDGEIGLTYLGQNKL